MMIKYEQKTKSGYSMESVELGKHLVRQMLEPFVEDEQELNVDATIDERGVFIEIRTSQNDRGRVIGRQGATISVVRDYMRLVGNKVGAYYSVRVVQNG